MNNVDKAVITVIGSDKVGIVYHTSKILYENKVNILDISQKVFTDNIFSMIMMLSLPSDLTIDNLRNKLTKLEELDVKFFISDIKIFNKAYRL